MNSTHATCDRCWEDCEITLTSFGIFTSHDCGIPYDYEYAELADISLEEAHALYDN